MGNKNSLDLNQMKSPKIPKSLPEFLDFEEIEHYFQTFDLNDKEGIRDKAMAECLYSSGLRISEMIMIELHHVNLTEDWLIVTGKGNKERFFNGLGTPIFLKIKGYCSFTILNANNPICFR